MTLPWKPDTEELFALRGSGGQRFTEFVSALLRAEGARQGLPQDDINTSVRVNIRDGGVDAEVRSNLGGPLALDFPTCWQFKATLFAEITVPELHEEANKGEAKRLIKAGYGYRVSVCDDAPSAKINKLDEALREIVRAINADAPTPRVLTASHLAEWSGHHAGVVLRFFRPHHGHVFSYEKWLRNERHEMPTFVEIVARNAVAERIRSFAAVSVPSLCVLSLAGPSGAGVSRLVAETLSAFAERVVYVPDPREAVRIVTSLVNHPTATGVVIIDRCQTNVRLQIERLLRAEAGRLRAVLIHDVAEDAPAAAMSLSTIDDADMHRAMDANFPQVPSRHRRAFVELADGVLKIAAKLATNYLREPSRFLPESAHWANEELLDLVRDETDRRLLQNLALFTRVGYKGSVSTQLERVCSLGQIDLRDAVRRLERIARSPGVILQGPRYVSVRPRLFARPLFEAAWKDLIGGRLAAFIDVLPAELQDAFLKQASRNAPDTAREELADWATPWVRDLRPDDLADADFLQRFLTLVEICPTRVGPTLASLVEQRTADVEPVTGRSGTFAQSRLISAVRGLLATRDTYHLAEAALFRLARVEGDPQASARSSSTATSIWAASFRQILSGTEVGFPERLAVLSAKLDRLGAEATPFVIAALNSVLDTHAFTIEGRPMRSGEVKPLDWQPRTYQELWDGLDSAIALLGRCLLEPSHRSFALGVFCRHGRGLLQAGRLKAVKAALGPVALDAQARVSLLGITEDFRSFDAARSRASEKHGYPEDYVGEVRAWAKTLEQTDLPGRVLEAISLASHSRRIDTSSLPSKELRALGKELFVDPHQLEQLFPVIGGADQISPALFELGRAVGQCDSSAALLERILHGARVASNQLFFRGYVVALTEHGEAHDGALIRGLKVLERHNPAMAVDLNCMSPRLGDAGARAIRLVRDGRLPPASLGQRWSFKLDGSSLADALETVLAHLSESPEDAAAIGLKILHTMAWNTNAPLPEDARTLGAIWRTLETALGGAHAEVDVWGRLLRRLSSIDCDRAIQLACRAMLTGDVSIDHEASSELAEYIKRDGALVLDILGPMLLDPEQSAQFGVGRRGDLLIGLPSQALAQWIVDNGVAAARAVAAHLPAPYVDARGDIVVPPLTALVLEKFEYDDEVFSSFCCGMHNLQVYSGNIADQHEREAEVAKRFRTHPLRRIREWAEQEERAAKWGAQQHREREEEMFDD